MDAGGSSSSSSSSSSSYLFKNVGRSMKSSEQPLHFHAILHSVGKPLMENPWKKQPVAPLPLIRPRFYKVDAVNFKNLVQKLTGANEISDHRLQTMAQAPLTGI